MDSRTFEDSRRSSQALSVLILEDEADWSAAEARLLHPAIATLPPVRFTRIAEAVAHLSAHEVDLVFLDLDVQDSQGLQTLERVRAASPLSAIVVMTTEEGEETALEALRHGAQDYLVKGSRDADVLRSTTRFVLERTRALLEAHRGEQIMARVLDALPFPAALLDDMGCILRCNDGWNDYANAANPLVHGCRVGDNYLALCDRLADSGSSVHQVAWGILQVMACLEARFTFEYAIPGPEAPLHCELTVTRMPMLLGSCVLICHHERGAGQERTAS